jgi:hypothetical protein
MLILANLLFAGTLLYAQQFRIKAGLIALPPNFATANIGAERMDKNGRGSWQLHYALLAGRVAADAGETHRKWVTLERSWYLGKKDKIKFIYSLFTEAGNRIKYPGFIDTPADSILKSRNYKELCPGAAIGCNIALSRRVGFQVLTGPKLIIPLSAVQYLYNANTKTNFDINEKKVNRAGFRFMASLYYEFTIKRNKK